jgi:hypothetical protein
LNSIPELIKIEGTETANLVLECFETEHENVLGKLDKHPQLQYKVQFFGFWFLVFGFWFLVFSQLKF